MAIDPTSGRISTPKASPAAAAPAAKPAAPAPKPAAAKPAAQPRDIPSGFETSKAAAASKAGASEGPDYGALMNIAFRTAMAVKDAWASPDTAEKESLGAKAKRIAKQAVSAIFHDPQAKAIVPAAMQGVSKVFDTVGQKEAARITRHAAKQLAQDKQLQAMLYLGQKAGEAVGGDAGGARGKRLVRAAITGYAKGDGPEKVVSTLASLASKGAEIGAEATTGNVSKALDKFAPIVGDMDNLQGVHQMVKRSVEKLSQTTEASEKVQYAIELASAMGAFLMPQVLGERPLKGLSTSKFEQLGCNALQQAVDTVNVNGNIFLTRREAENLPKNIRSIYDAFVNLPEHKGKSVTVEQFAEYFCSLQEDALRADVNGDGMISQLERSNLPPELQPLYTALLRRFGRQVPQGIDEQ